MSVVLGSYGQASVAVVHRPLGGIAGYRQVLDRSSSIAVHAFPMAMLTRVVAAGLLSAAGAYVVTDDRVAYIGETMLPSRRLAEHASDISKRAFSRDAFVVTGREGCGLDKAQVLDLQYRLTASALEAGLVAVMKSASPPAFDLSEVDRATHDRIFADAVRLLFDAGCRFFRIDAGGGNDASAVPAEGPMTEDPTDGDAGAIEIGVTTTPLGAEEYELTYADAWARGYWANGHFIVAAGSEVRLQTNGSVNSVTRARRDELARAGVLARIPGVEGRRRLITAVAFPSASAAAKAVCGAHTAGRWVPLTRSKIVVLAGMTKQAL